MSTLNSQPISKSAAWIVRALLLVLGTVMIVYAVSDHPLYGDEPGFGRLQILISALGGAIALCSLLPMKMATPVLILGVTSLAMLGLAEVAGEMVLGARYRPIFQPDDRLIFKFIPNRRSVMTRAPRNGGETITHRINSEGFRGDKLRPAGSAARVVVYGDSFIHAYYTAQENTFTARLGVLLSEQMGREVEAVNAGLSSYGPDQISLKMEDELPKLRPDLVVVSIFAGNDYGDLLRSKIFRIGDGGALQPNNWILDPKVRMWLQISQQESILLRALRSIVRSRSSAPVTKADATNLEFLLAEAEREYQSFIVEGDNVVTNTHLDYYSADVSLRPKSASALYKVALMREVLRRIRDVAARNGVTLVFLFIPHPADVTESYDQWRFDRTRFPDYDGRNQTGPLEDMARSLSVPFVSLHHIFREKDANSLYFHGGDDHWNDAGQAMAARVMTDFLMARRLPQHQQPASIMPPPGHTRP